MSSGNSSNARRASDCDTSSLTPGKVEDRWKGGGQMDRRQIGGGQMDRRQMPSMTARHDGTAHHRPV